MESPVGLAKRIGVLVGFALVAATSAYVYRSSIAVGLAPESSADASRSEQAKTANAKFREAFHG
jgi:hypothetical protein